MRNERMYRELLEFIMTDSASGKESEIAKLLSGRLKELGFMVIRDQAGETFGGECGNIFAYLDGAVDGSILFSSHLDRVSNGLGIRPVERDGILYSDGTTILAADDAAGICAILEGLRMVLADGEPLPRIELLFTVGEEAGLFGAKAFDMSQLQSRIGYVFDSSGPAGRLINAAPGMYMLSAEITGRSAHAGSEPEKGINAAKIMCDMISTLKQGRLDEMTTSNFPMISTGSTACNVVCDKASFKGEARSRDKARLEDYVAYFERHCRKAAEQNRAEIRIEKKCLFQPFIVEERHPCLQLMKQAMEELGIPCRAEYGGGAMDANIFNANGIACIGVATGYAKNHTKEEQLVLEDFYRSGEAAAAVIRAYVKSCSRK